MGETHISGGNSFNPQRIVFWSVKEQYWDWIHWSVIAIIARAEVMSL